MDRSMYKWLRTVMCAGVLVSFSALLPVQAQDVPVQPQQVQQQAPQQRFFMSVVDEPLENAVEIGAARSEAQGAAQDAARRTPKRVSKAGEEIKGQQIAPYETYCIFNSGRDFKVWLENASVNCDWELKVEEDSKLEPSVTSTSGPFRDTAYMRLKFAASDLTKVQEVTISEKTSSTGIIFYIPRVASKAGQITISGLLGDKFYCGGTKYSVFTPADANYNSSRDNYTNPAVAGDERLRYTWTIQEKDNDGVWTPVKELTPTPPSRERDKSYMYRTEAEIEDDYEGYYWYVQPRTCETSNPRAEATNLKIENVIPSTTLLPTNDDAYKDVKFKVAQMEYDGDWKEKKEGGFACTFYSDEFNTSTMSQNPAGTQWEYSRANSNNYWDGVVDKTTQHPVNGYMVLQVSPYEPDNELYKHFKYKWHYDTANLERIDNVPSTWEGFGEDTMPRIYFKVRNRPDLPENRRRDIWAYYEINCPACQQKAIAESKPNLKFRIYSDTLRPKRIDSIPANLDFSVYYQDELYGQKVTLALTDTMELCGNQWYSLCAEYDHEQVNNGNVKGSLWYISPIAQESDGADCGGYKVLTKKIAETESLLGIYRTSYVRPYNACFINQGDTAESCRLINVHIRTVPAKPTVIDTMTGLSIPGTTLVKKVIENEGVVDPGGSVGGGGWPGGGDPGGDPGADPGAGGGEENVVWVLRPGLPPVLVCNNSGIPNSPGTLGTTFKIYTPHNKVRPQKYDNSSSATRKEGGFGVVFPDEVKNGGTTYFSYRIDPTRSGSANPHDTSYITFNPLADDGGYATLKNAPKYIPFGIYVANECGPGDTGFFAVNIIDTLPVYKHVADANNMEDLTYDTIRKCEGVSVQFKSDVSAYTDHLGLYDSARCSDRVEFVWRKPATWSYVNRAQDSAKNPSRLYLGREKGWAELALRNRCGYSSFRKSDFVDVDAYVRLTVKVAEAGTVAGLVDAAHEIKTPPTDQYLVHPCSYSSVTYAADTFERCDGYMWIFPDDWVVEENFDPILYETAENDPLRKNVAYTYNDSIIAEHNEMRVQVKVGNTHGEIQVIGKKDFCNFTYNNYAEGTDPLLVRGHHINKQPVTIRPYTAAPVKAYNWPERLCARCEWRQFTLAVEPDPAQDSMTRANTYFEWVFKTPHWQGVSVTYKNRADRKFSPDIAATFQFNDSATFIVPDTLIPDLGDTLLVISHRHDCEDSKGDTLRYYFGITDTLSLDPASYFLDDRKSRPISITPCEGDTVIYRLDGNNLTRGTQTIEGIWYTWNGGNTFFSGDSVDETGWRVLNNSGQYSGSLTMVVGRSPLRVGAQAMSYCGKSAIMYSDTINPIYLIHTKASWEAATRELLCSGESFTFRHDSVLYADGYRWYYPWCTKEAGFDTLTVMGNMVNRPWRPFNANTVYDTGLLFVRPFNVCGTGPYSDTVKISTVVRRLARPDSIQSIDRHGNRYGYAVKPDGTVSASYDTVCLRNEYTYQAFFADTLYPDAEWVYNWFAYSVNAADQLEHKGAALDTLVLHKEEGREITDLLGVSVRHSQCELYGDTLQLKLYATDTILIPAGKVVQDYLRDLLNISENEKVITKPCSSGGADSVAMWVFDKERLDASATQMQFVWRAGTSASFDRTWSGGSDSTMDGTGFRWLNCKDNPGTLDSKMYPNDTLHMRVGNGDSLLITVNVENRCGFSHLPPVTVKSLPAIKAVQKLSIKAPVTLNGNTIFCDMEANTLVSPRNDTIDKYIWFYSYLDEGGNVQSKQDTGYTPEKSFDDISLTEGYIFFIPKNGCGVGDTSEKVKVEHIYRVRKTPEPYNFDPAFDASQVPALPAKDSLCMRSPQTLQVYLPSGNGSDTVEILWHKLQGPASGYTLYQNTDSVKISALHLSDPAYKLSVKTKVKGCQKYSDSLVIQIYPMDTVSFVQAIDEEAGDVLGAFEVLLPGLVLDFDNLQPFNTNPCEEGETKFVVKNDIHWSYNGKSYFSWSKQSSGSEALLPDLTDGTMLPSDWHYVPYFALTATDTLGFVHARVGTDTVQLYLNVRNICGWSKSPAIQLSPRRKVTQKPSLVPPAHYCLGEEATFDIDRNAVPEFSESVYWTYPWGKKHDTVDVSYRASKVVLGTETGKVWVSGGNICGTGPADTVEVSHIIQIPHRPVPAWNKGGRADYTYTSGSEKDTVVEYICLHGYTEVAVTHQASDAPGIKYQWAALDETDDNITLLSNLPGLPDSMARFVVKEGIDAGSSAGFMVYGSYPDCGGTGDTLFIRLYLDDTVSSELLGNAVYQKAPNGEYLEPGFPEPCPGAELEFTLENAAAYQNLRYNWQLPSDWTFKVVGEDPALEILPSGWNITPVGDSTAYKVVVRVGKQSGEVKVNVGTDASRLGCVTLASVAKTAGNFYPRQPIELNTGHDNPRWPAGNVVCAGQWTEIELDPTSNIKHYKIQVPSGWKIKFPEDRVLNPNEYEGDTVWKTATEPVFEFKVGTNSGDVIITPIDSCAVSAVEGIPGKFHFTVRDTARLTVNGNGHICRDSSVILKLSANRFADSSSYSLVMRGTNYLPDTLSVTIGRYMGGKYDSSFVYITSPVIDSFYLEFTPLHPQCPANVETTVFLIQSDTTPEINGTVSGPLEVCEDNLYYYEFHYDGDVNTIAGGLQCLWKVPEGWQEVSHPTDTSAVLRFKHLPSDGSTTALIECYPVGICGTAPAKTISVQMRSADVFNDVLIVDETEPCTGTEISAYLQDSASYRGHEDSIKLIWVAPDSWTLLTANDSFTSAAYRTVFSGKDDTLTVRKWIDGACGLSQPLSVEIKVRDVAEAAVPADGVTMYPCYSKTFFRFPLKRSVYPVDSVIWSFASIINGNLSMQVYTSQEGNFKNDSLLIFNPGTDPFDEKTKYKDSFLLKAVTYNKCGSRDTVFTVRPVSTHTDFTGALTYSRICPFDTGYAFTVIPVKQRDVEAAQYSWNIEWSGGLSGMREEIVSDTVFRYNADYYMGVVRYTILDDTILLSLRAENDCGEYAPMQKIITPFNLKAVVKRDPDTGIYLQTGRIDLDSIITNAAPFDMSGYTYSWEPQERIATDAGRIILTGKFYYPVEKFTVTARMKDDNPTGMPYYMRKGVCTVSDTVYYPVDSIFGLVSVDGDTVCQDEIFNIGANLTCIRGDSAYWVFWQMYDEDSLSWYTVSDSTVLAAALSEPGVYHFRLVGYDSTEVMNASETATLGWTSHSDTTYFDLSVYGLQAAFANAGGTDIEVPLGSSVELSLKVKEGTGDYYYDWKSEYNTRFARINEFTGTMRTEPLLHREVFTVTVIDTLSHCRRTLSLHVTPGKENRLPNTFTPNGDNINDTFLPGVNKLTIYSRWGEELVCITDGGGWDGTYNGQLARPGEYLYVAEVEYDVEDSQGNTASETRATRETKVIKGVVTLMFNK